MEILKSVIGILLITGLVGYGFMEIRDQSTKAGFKEGEMSGCIAGIQTLAPKAPPELVNNACLEILK